MKVCCAVLLVGAMGCAGAPAVAVKKPSTTRVEATSSKASKAATAATVVPSTPKSSPQLLFEESAKALFGACPGVELRRRGAGYLAGRYGGPIVLVSGEGSCRQIPETETKAASVVLAMTFRTIDPATKAEIGVLRRREGLKQRECPTDFSTLDVLDTFIESNDRLCTEGFVPMRVPMSMVTLLTPVLIQLGSVTLQDDGQGNAGLLWQTNGRKLVVDGTAVCRPRTNDLEDFGKSSLRNLFVELDVAVTEPATGKRVGQWHDDFIAGIHIGCDQLMGRDPERLLQAQEVWRERFAVAEEASRTP